MRAPHLCEGVKFEPYWWGAVEPVGGAQSSADEALPARADVVIVGAGYAGLSAALTLARSGRSVVVCEAGAARTGASTRNGGQAAGQVKPSLGALIERLGVSRAVTVYREAQSTLDHLESLVREEGIACDFTRVGRLQPAFTEGDRHELDAEAARLAGHLGIEAPMLDGEALAEELVSPYYRGAMLRTDMATVQPARLHGTLLRRAREAGVTIVEHSAVQRIQREARGFQVHVAQGSCRARDVIVATNGYTGRLIPWLRRRVVPIPSQIIATETLADGRMDTLIPRRRAVVDTCRLHHYYRPSPDGRRILLGGRAGTVHANNRRIGLHLHGDLLRIFPQLEGVRIEYVWSGYTGYSFDYLPHLGVRDGIHFTLGFCGGGVTWGPYLGHKIALQLIGSPEARTVFADQSLITRPLYTGRPWFLPLILNYYRLRDRLAAAGDGRVSRGPERRAMQAGPARRGEGAR